MEEEQAPGHLYQLLNNAQNNTQNGLFSKHFAVILFINTEFLTHAHYEKMSIKEVDPARV